MSELTDQEVGVLRKIRNGELWEPKHPVSSVLEGMHRMGYLRLLDELAGPLALKTGGKLIRITDKGLAYLESRESSGFPV